MSCQQVSRCTLHFPPERPNVISPSVVLYGAIESSPTDNWATHLSTALSDLPVAILNPRNDDYGDWTGDINCRPFKEQVDWEIDQAAVANIIAFYFKPGTLTPVALLELGMHAALYGKKCVVCCPEGFYKRGNVQIVCGRFEVELVGTLDALRDVVRAKMENLLERK